MPQTLTDHMVSYYWNRVWYHYLPFVTKEGAFKNDYDPSYKIGDESPIRDGALVFGNGGHLERQMELDQLIDQENIHHAPVHVPNVFHFEDFMELHKKEDGAKIFDGTKETMQHIGIVNPNAPKMADISYNIEQVLPQDYLTIDSSKPRKKRGGRTDTAIKISTAYPWADVYVMNESSYSKLGPGMMSHWRGGKLIETWALINPEKERYQMDKKDTIVWGQHGDYKVGCIYRRYVDDDGNQRRDENGNLTPIFHAFVDRYSKDRNGNYLCYQPRQQGSPAIQASTEISPLEQTAMAQQTTA